MSKFSRQRIQIMGAAKENDQSPNVFAHSLGIHRIVLSDEKCKFLLGV